MKCLHLPLALAAGTLALTPLRAAGQPVAGGVAEGTARPRMLSKADDEWVTKKYEEALTFGRAGKWGPGEAQRPVLEILARCKSVLGKDHFLTAHYAREIEDLKKLAALPAADRAEYVKTYALYESMDDLWKKERYADALRPAEQMLAIYRRILGPDAYYAAAATSWCGQLLCYEKRYPEAEKQLREAVRVFRGVVGEDDTAVARAYLFLGQVRYDLEQYAVAEKELREALRIYHRLVGEDHTEVSHVYLYLAPTVEKQGRYADARPLYEANVDVSTRLRGERSGWTGVAINNLAAYLDRQAFYREAEDHQRKAVAIFRAAGDPYATLLATALNNLALKLSHQAKYAEADALFREALAIRRRLKGEHGGHIGRVTMNLASNLEAQGHLASAEVMYRQALDLYRAGYGPDHPETAWAMTNLAVHLDRRGALAEGERLLRDALSVVSRAPGDQNRSVAKITNNLAWCLRAQGRVGESQARCEEALALLRGRLPADHPELAAVLNNLATTLSEQGRYTDAERHFREALAIMVRRLGPDHPDTSLGRANLGANLYHQGKFDEANGYYRDALAAYRRVLGDGHPSTAWAYMSLIGSDCARGDYPGAEALAPAATASFEAARLRLGLAGLDRALSTRDISPLAALAVTAARRGKPAAAWEAMERNLARGLLDELSARRLSDEDRRRQQDLADDVEQLDQRIDLLRARGEVAAADGRAAQLRRDTAQAKLVQFQEGLADKYGVAAGQVYDLAAIQKQLADDAALLAWVDLPAAPKWADPKGDHWACLVRHHGDPVWVQLRGAGPDGAWTDGDDRLADRTRHALAARPDDRSGEWKDLAGRLADQRLGPLTAELKSVRHLIVLPSAKLAGVPVDTLPGVADRFVVSYAPSGTMSAWLREHRVDRGPQPGLLALGDPAFPPPRDDGADAKPGGPRPAGRREAFAPLPGTGAELSGVARIFRNKRVLTGSEASEQDLEQLAAADRLRDYRFLHFATHGVLDSQQPMRSALVLAQDRLPDPLAPASGGREIYDGRLTAERILRRWKLHAELVTLSGCDTGLGRFSGGEGHLGFSQALFLAGARSLVLSLWEVDDASTALLMTRFYENLFGEGSVQSMSKAEALAEAKKWLRGLGPEEVGQLTKDLATRGTRGRVIDRQPAGKEAAARTYEHPYYWAGFILIGDPR